jgi:hypothetical protein
MKSRFNPALPYGVAAFDAGAANLIFSLIKGMPQMPVWRSLDGPARQVWSNYFPDDGIHSESVPTRGLHALITGTGWGSDFEHRMRFRAKAEGIFSVAVLDHWINYESRFFHRGFFCFPDEIWVSDPAAQRVARRCFPQIPVILRSNDYLENEVSRICPVAEATSDDVLYLLEPTRSTWGRDTPGEFQALDYFLARTKEIRTLNIGELRLRLHPSEPPDKYDHYLNQDFGYNIAIATRSLAEEISRVKNVVGCQTFAMVIALHAGRSVYSSLPPWAPPCALPHSGIIHLKNV